MKLVGIIYDYFRNHTRMMWLSLCVLTVIFAGLVMSLHFSEDISDFLPMDADEQEQLAVYQNISGASRIFVLFRNPDDADLTVEAIDCFADNVYELDSLGWCSGMTSRIDMTKIRQVSDFVYGNMPYFLDKADYARMDSLLAEPGYVQAQLLRGRQMLMFPTGGMVETAIANDPLGLFAPVMKELQGANPNIGFEMYDGYIFSPDMSRAVVMLNSPFGNAETEHNTQLLGLLHTALERMQADYPTVSADIVGGPEIAVGNSSRIKKDSLIAITLSVILIILFAIYSIRSLRNTLLIFLSIGWGWLFAMAGLSLLSSNVSIIVIGISSVILGIAVNYPLHLIVHEGHSPGMKSTLREIVTPLVIGNITTVGAFLALVPLKSVALRDLGTFASLLLVGTIVFVLVYMPHMVKSSAHRERKSILLDKIAALEPDKSRILVAAMVALTAVFGYFSFGTEFDSNMANINYMTPGQRENMQYFQSLVSSGADDGMRKLYVVNRGSDFDAALEQNERSTTVIDSLVSAGKISSHKGVRPFLVSEDMQRERLNMWEDFTQRHSELLLRELPLAAQEAGFAPSAFQGFSLLVSNAGEFRPQGMDYFKPLTDEVLIQNITSLDGDRHYVIDVLSVRAEDMSEIKGCFDSCFDVESLNSSLSQSLSDNFNYIGWACSLIVFFFLWYSLGSLELALISFLPMAVSWIWILGIMALCGIKFNIVNVILATFIFGQGDDYTIFVTEGCQYEYARRRPILASYKSSILQSALIMFVGIGTLIIAKHPAMRSLAQVTITGMFSVVLMSYVIPPFIFRWITTKDGVARKYPLTIKQLIFGEPTSDEAKVISRYLYKGNAIVREVKRNLRDKEKYTVGLFGGQVCEQSGDQHSEQTSVQANGAPAYEVRMTDPGYGELTLLAALSHPGVRIISSIPDEDRRRIATIAAEGFAPNVEFTE